jgi:hypothetical protein
MADADTTQAYSLLPWVRRGIASRISGTPAVNYATVPVSVAVNRVPVPAPPKVRLPGPGDVKTIDARAFIRTDPMDGTDNFEPNYLAIVELATPDLPFRHMRAEVSRSLPDFCTRFSRTHDSGATPGATCSTYYSSKPETDITSNPNSPFLS